MRNILALVGGVTVTFLGLGWYLGWYKIDSNPLLGRQNVHVEINPEKITQDVKKGAVIVEQGVEDFRNRQDAKPAPLTTPQGPASDFFGPSSTANSQSSFAPPSFGNNKPAAPADDSLFGIRLPRK
ncbi:hypothetical protein [Zavarzinella formosa]|uniref:hypothetical protein n=1 Tax=Zavarzinella formosa TaxID=360055 RepID=UPI0003172821|nr:hypothetical protein [Zavarzinella formosa]